MEKPHPYHHVRAAGYACMFLLSFSNIYYLYTIDGSHQNADTALYVTLLLWLAYIIIFEAFFLVQRIIYRRIHQTAEPHVITKKVMEQDLKTFALFVLFIAIAAYLYQYQDHATVAALLLDAASVLIFLMALAGLFFLKKWGLHLWVFSMLLIIASSLLATVYDALYLSAPIYIAINVLLIAVVGYVGISYPYRRREALT